MARLFLILVISAFGQTASAGSITLTFDEFTCSGDPVFEGRQGPITYTNPNQFAYSNCGPRILVGDDGFSQKAAIRADEGTVFDVTSFDLSADYDVYRFPRAALNDAFNQTIETDGIGGFGILLEEVLFWDVGPNLELKFEADAEKLASFDYFELLGYRDGALVAEDAFDPAGVSNYAPGDAFENLDEMILGVSVSGYSTWFDDEYIYGCAIQCGSATYDNVVLQTRVAVAPVPLPATALLMGIGLLALWPLRRLRRRA